MYFSEQKELKTTIKKIVVTENAKCNELGGLMKHYYIAFFYILNIRYIFFTVQFFFHSTDAPAPIQYHLFFLVTGLDLIAVVLLLDMKVI